MVIFLIAVILLLVAGVIYLNVQFYKEKRVFKVRLESLRQIIVDSSKKQNGQANQLKLCEALDERLKSNRAMLSNDIFKLQFELFDILSKNNLLKK
jgi:hypothetical protein